ncbi:MAG TPA: hypothetical protein VHN14_22790 [Kofleriaceae bacterium]|nr:hypothetical protein [Kofleriaceae bacterium]
MVDKLVYTATNPVLDHLVERTHHWPGVNTFIAMLAGRQLRATRPRHFFRSDGPMPDALEMSLTIPSELGPKPALLSELRERVRTVQLDRAAERTVAKMSGREPAWTTAGRGDTSTLARNDPGLLARSEPRYRSGSPF